MSLQALRHNKDFRATVCKTVFLFGVVVTFLFVGAAIFQVLEYEARNDVVDDALDEIETERHNVLDVLWAHTLVMEQNDWMQMAHEKLDIYEKTLIRHAAKGIDTDDDIEDDDNPWSFIGSLFYCYTCVTTIGYGNFAPVSSLGRCITIIYSMIGVPLFLIYLKEMGKCLTMILKALLTRKSGDYQSGCITKDFDFSITASVVILLMWIILGAGMFDILEEDWDFIESIYFCFITASTIGFGDFTPDEEHEMIVAMLYSTTTLALCAMCFTVIENSFDKSLSTKCESMPETMNYVCVPLNNFCEKLRCLIPKKSDDKNKEE